MKQKQYYFALHCIMADLNIKNVNQFHKRFFSDGSLSRQSLNKLCKSPSSIRETTVNIICNHVGITPADLWRVR